MRRVAWMALAIAALVVGLPATAQECIDSEGIAQGPISGHDPSPRCESGDCPGADLVIDNADSWSRLWRAHTSNVSPPPPLPEVNFRTQIVLATFMGKRPTSHHLTEIDCVEDAGLIGGHAWVASIVEKSPGSGCIVNQVVTNPYDFVVLDRPTGSFGEAERVSVSFETTELIVGCDGGGPICRVCPPGGFDGNGGAGNIEPDDVPCCP